MKFYKAAYLGKPTETFIAPDGKLGIDWHVFDDHVSVNENVVINGDGTFSLNARPVGTARVLCVNNQEYPFFDC